MASDGDLGVDVLIIGGGIQGLYLARSLDKRYSVCIVTDPDAPSETLDAPGYFSAGYDGNDVARIQPARRAAGFWRLWAESNNVPHASHDTYFVMSADEESLTTRLWSDATLAAKPAVALPHAFRNGSLEGWPSYLVENDVVMNPTDFMAKLREGLDDRIIWGRIQRFVLATDDGVDFVEVVSGDDVVTITPRFVVICSNVGNGSLLGNLAARFKDQARRRDAADKVRSCQAVRRRLTIAFRGNGLPLVAGHFDGLQITAHDFKDTSERVWLVNPPIIDAQTVLGPEEVRFEPTVDATAVASTLDLLFSVAPEIERISSELVWSAYMARKTEHPAMAVADTSNVAQPASAKLETFGMSSMIAMWPSHLSYAMVVGDVVAERVEQALGEPVDFSDGVQPDEFAAAAPHERMVSRWERDAFPWTSWREFAEAHDFKRN